MIKEFFERMWKLEEQGVNAILAGDLTQARRIVRQMNEYPDEQYTLKLRIKLASMLSKGECPDAIDRAHHILGYKWGDPYALSILRLGNPAVNSKCKIFELDVHAGARCRTPLGSFPSEYTCTFIVVAETTEQALTYIAKAFGVIEGSPLVVNKETIHPEGAQNADIQGVYDCSPFSKIEGAV